MLFQVIQEATDQGRRDLFESQFRRRSMQAMLSEFEQLAKRIPVRADGVGTRLALLHQPLQEKALK
jgi:hypothetical protein